jgi:hypothetical protein
MLSFLMTILPLLVEFSVTERKITVDHVALKAKAAEALAFCRKNEYSTDRCLLIDMSLHSGVKRFFVYDLVADTIAKSYLVTHGTCDGPWAEDGSKDLPQFSNVRGSHCSSLGKYRIGERGYSQWGIGVKYVLHGLESTNNNAQGRFVVLHSWEAVPDEEIHPQGCPESWGCPALSDAAMREVDELLKDRKKPVLLWIYN